MTTRKTAASTTATTRETPAAKTPAQPKAPRAASPKKAHVLYQADSTSIHDVLFHGDRTKAWEDLATEHTGDLGWKYIAVEHGASLADAIAAKAGA